MTDVFISYSKRDYALAERLAGVLRANGFSVWWDNELNAGDDFHDEIIRAIDGAAVTIVIWSPSSVKSQWVRGEAQHANDLNKLVPIKTLDCGVQEVPLNFRSLHTETINNTDRILQSLKRRVDVKLSGLSAARNESDVLGKGEYNRPMVGGGRSDADEAFSRKRFEKTNSEEVLFERFRELYDEYGPFLIFVGGLLLLLFLSYGFLDRDVWIMLINGIVAGWLAGQMLGGGGLLRNLVVGVLGAFTGGAMVKYGLLSLPAVVTNVSNSIPYGTQILISTIGAMLVILVARFLGRS